MAKKPTVRASVERCYIYVEGFILQCPLCRLDVPSGHEHECEKDGGVRTVVTRPKKKR